MTEDAARPPVQLHRRQFVIGPEPHLAREDWCSSELAPSVWLSHCPDLRVSSATDAGGERWTLLGRAVQTVGERQEPLVEIARTPTAEVPGLYATWAGRWVLVGQGEVHLDAVGLLCCYHGQAPGGELWASSSPVLAARLVQAERGGSDKEPLVYRTGVFWIPLPRSRFDLVHKLLPSQVLGLREGRVWPRRLVPGIDRDLGYEGCVEGLGEALLTALRRLEREASPLWISLTGGLDSRTVLAAARAAGVQAKAFTRLTRRVSTGDRALPPVLARQAGYQHRFLRSGRGTADRRGLLADHSAGHVSDGDAQPLLEGSRDELTGVSLGGECWPMAFPRLRRLGAPDSMGPPEDCARRVAALMGEPPGSARIAGLGDWLDWVRAHPDDVDWRDRFGMEQSHAGWASAKEQVYDMLRVERFFLVNSARTYALLFGLNPGQRAGKRLQVDVIRRLAPDLLRHPPNPGDRDVGLARAVRLHARDDPLYAWRKLAGKARRLRAREHRG